MRYAPLFSLLLAATLFTGCANGSKELVAISSHPQLYARGTRVIDSIIDRNLLSSLVIDYINLYRSKRNVALLNYEDKASEAAFWMSDYQARAGQVSHVAKAAGMNRMGDRYRSVGGGAYAAAYENTGWYPLFNSPDGRNFTYDEMARNIVDGWINSPKHHEGLIVNAQGKGYIGLGVARGKYNGVTGIFATMDIFFYLPQWTTDNSETAQTQQSSPALTITSEPISHVTSQSQSSTTSKTTTKTQAKKKPTSTRRK